MTEFWKSNPMHWCDICKVWMNDSKQAKLNHERGIKHQENLAKKLRDMAKKADAQKAEEKSAAATMNSIEEAARKQFEKDQEAAAAIAGKWVWDEASVYYYNELHRWYYDSRTKWYYGGTPVAWTQTPSMPAVAMFGTAPLEGGPEAVAATAGRPPGGSAPAAGLMLLLLLLLLPSQAPK
eukprot:jgi/Chrzof1/4394/Cz14g11150.t1